MYGFAHYLIQLLQSKFYAGLKLYVDYQGGLPTNDGLSPTTPVDTITTAISKASAFYNIPKVIIVMRGTATKKGAINESILVNVPWTMIDFNMIGIYRNVNPATVIKLAENFTGVVNVNIDGSSIPDDSGNVGIEFSNGIECFCIGGLISGFSPGKALKDSASGAMRFVIGNVIIGNEVGIELNNGKQGFIMNNAFTQNVLAIKDMGGAQNIVSRNYFDQNITDIDDESYEYTATDGVGSLNKLTSVSANWTSGQWVGMMLIDSVSLKPYKIIENTATELIITDVALDGSSKDITPANGTFYIVNPDDDMILFENYWSKLKEVSPDIYGDSNNDGVMDRLVQIPTFGIGVGKSSSIDKKPLIIPTVMSGSTNIDFMNQIMNNLFGIHNCDFIKATVDIPERNVKIGMLDKVKRVIAGQDVFEEFIYDTNKDVIKTKIGG